jgi:hypothetical protein
VASVDQSTSAAAVKQPKSTTRERVLFVVGCALGGAVLGVPAGYVWVQAANPPSAALTADGVYFGEAQLNQQAGVTLWYLVVGVGFGLVAGLIAGSLGQRHGVAAVVGVFAACVAAAAVSYGTGAHLFGPDQRVQLASAEVGDRITSSVRLDTLIAVLGWPIGGLMGGLAAILRWPQEDPREDGAIGLHWRIHRSNR